MSQRLQFAVQALVHAANSLFGTKKEPSREKLKRGDTRRKALFIEGLERRELMAGDVTATFNAGLLRVEGTPASDQIRIVPIGAYVRVERASPTGVWSAAAGQSLVPVTSVNRIVVDGLAGNDRIETNIAPNKIQVEATGNGNDRLAALGASSQTQPAGLLKALQYGSSTYELRTDGSLYLNGTLRWTGTRDIALAHDGTLYRLRTDRILERAAPGSTTSVALYTTRQVPYVDSLASGFFQGQQRVYQLFANGNVEYINSVDNYRPYEGTVQAMTAVYVNGQQRLYFRLSNGNVEFATSSGTTQVTDKAAHFRDMAKGLKNAGGDYADIARAVSNVSGNLRTTAEAILHGIPESTYTDVARGIYGVTGNMRTVAEAILHGIPESTYMDIARGIFGVTGNMRTVAEAILHGIPESTYNDVARGIYGVKNDMRAVADAILYGIVESNPTEVAKAILYGIPTATYTDVANGLYTVTGNWRTVAATILHGIPESTYTDVARGIFGVTESMRTVADAILHGIPESTYKDVARGIYGVKNDMRTVADAILYGIVESNPTEVAKAILYGIPTATYTDVANGLYTVTGNWRTVAATILHGIPESTYTDVARGILSATNNTRTVADAILHGIPESTYKDVAKGIYGITSDMKTVADAILFGIIESNPRQIAEAILHGIPTSTYTDVARSLFAVTGDMKTVADAILHGIPESTYGDISSAIYAVTPDTWIVADAILHGIQELMPNGTLQDLFSQFHNSVPVEKRDAILEGLANLTNALANDDAGLGLWGAANKIKEVAEHIGGAISTEGRAAAGIAAGVTFKNLADGVSNVVKDSVSNLLTSIDGLSATIVQPLRDFTGVLYSIADGNSKRAWDLLLRGTLGLQLNVAGPATWVSGVLVDFLGELRGEWSGRSLNADERTTLQSVFGNDINCDRVKIVYDAMAIGGRAFVNGTTIFVPGSIELPLGTLIHEATHVVQKQKYHFDVTGRGVVEQIANTLGAEAYDFPQIHDNDTMWTVLQREGAERHATMVERFYTELEDHDGSSATLTTFLADDKWSRYADLFKRTGWFSQWLGQ